LTALFSRMATTCRFHGKLLWRWQNFKNETFPSVKSRYFCVTSRVRSWGRSRVPRGFHDLLWFRENVSRAPFSNVRAFVFHRYQTQWPRVQHRHVVLNTYPNCRNNKIRRRRRAGVEWGRRNSDADSIPEEIVRRSWVSSPKSVRAVNVRVQRGGGNPMAYASMIRSDRLGIAVVKVLMSVRFNVVRPIVKRNVSIAGSYWKPVGERTGGGG